MGRCRDELVSRTSYILKNSELARRWVLRDLRMVEIRYPSLSKVLAKITVLLRVPSEGSGTDGAGRKVERGVSRRGGMLCLLSKSGFRRWTFSNVLVG